MNINDIKTVAVVGAGDMGHGIAEVALLTGYRVNLYDIKDEFVERGRDRIFSSVAKLVEKGRVPAELDEAIRNKLLKTTTDLAEAAADADLVIEAVPEIMDLKKQVFGDLDKAAPAHTLLASNTSTMSITEIASATSRQDKVFGLHYFNPAVLMRLVARRLVRVFSRSTHISDDKRDHWEQQQQQQQQEEEQPISKLTGQSNATICPRPPKILSEYAVHHC